MNTKRAVSRAFTLVECLAVVALMALAVGTVAVGVAPAADAARLREARSAVLAVDARARVLARQGEPVLLTIEGGVVRAVLAGDDRHRVILERQLAGITEASLRDPTTGHTLAAVRIDSAGQSDDFVLHLVASDRRSETLVAGLTGYVFKAEERMLEEFALDEFPLVEFALGGTAP